MPLTSTREKRQRQKMLRIGQAISILMGIALWGAHFTKASYGDSGLPYPPMNAGFELLFSYGRIISIACMVFSILLFKFIFGAIKLTFLRGGALWIGVLNFYLVAKLLFYMQDFFVIQASVVLILTIVSLVVVMGELEGIAIRLENGQRSFVALSVWISGVMIIATNVVALVLYPDSSMGESRMHGTTGNPQHLAMMCALVAPAGFYIIGQHRFFSFVGIVSFAMLSGIGVIEYETGSRTGFAAVLICALISLREYFIGKKVLLGILVAALVFWLIGDQLVQLVFEKFVEGREDSRSAMWIRAWQLFQENIIFGADPLSESGRLIIVENTWLAAAMSGGLFALLLSIVALIKIMKSLVVLNRADTTRLARFYSSALASIIAVSFFEAALLGLFATYTMLSYMYLGGCSTVASLSIRKRPKTW